MSGGVTTNYGLAKPNFNLRPWDSQVNSNFDLIDTLIYTLTQIPNIGGVWKNSTQYLTGQNVLDPITLTFYQCLISNVSAPTGTFAADRAANPANWIVTSAGAGTLRYDQGQALTSGQTLQALNNLNAFAYFLRYDAAVTLTTSQLNQMLANLQLAGAVKYDAAQTLTYNQILQVLNNLLIDGTESILTAATTTDIGNAGSQNIRIDGTTTIVSFGARPNKYKILRFTGVLVLTNSASLVLPGGQNITTQAGDTCIATSDANNNWYVRAYQRVDGTPIVGFGTTNLYTVPATPSTGVTLSATDFDKPYNVTGTTTVTVGAVGNGFRTGPVKNANVSAGIITLAVPNAATLDGQANGTLLLFPGQKARIVQTGSTSYISEWLDRYPLLFQSVLTSAQAVTSVDIPVADGYKRFAFDFSIIVNANTQIVWRVSDTDASGIKSGASDYRSQQLYSAGTSTTSATNDSSSGFLSGPTANIATVPNQVFLGKYDFYPGEVGTNLFPKLFGQTYYVDNTPTSLVGTFAALYFGGTSGAINRSKLLRFALTTGSFYGQTSLRGIV